MTHDTTGRYWRFNPCGHCDDANCCEGDSVDVTAEIEGLRAELQRLRRERDDARNEIECATTQVEAEVETLAEQVRTLNERDVRVTAARDELSDALASCEKSRDALRDERDRLISANDTLVTRIEDLTQGYSLEDTCPRVQCRTTSRRLKADLMAAQEQRQSQVDALVAERDQYRSDASRLEAERDKWVARALKRSFERDEMRPVIQAACDWLESWGSNNPDTQDEELALAINTYRATKCPKHHGCLPERCETCPERDETNPAITSSTQDSNADSDRETGHNNALAACEQARDAMRDVVEQAIAWHGLFPDGGHGHGQFRPLYEAASAYLATTSSTQDSNADSDRETGHNNA